jgi:DNA-binding response OmpR family regulator
MKILLLDDEEALLKALRLVLTDLGHAVDIFTDAEEAARTIEEGKYDFALVDYMMPVRNGIWFMKNARIPRKTKVLLMTAFVNRDVINEMFKLGARGYLIKPIDQDELNHHLNFHTSERPLEPIREPI